jgi:hypothetical protein
MTNPDSSVSDFYLLAGSRQHQQEAKQHGSTNWPPPVDWGQQG